MLVGKQASGGPLHALKNGCSLCGQAAGEDWITGSLYEGSFLAPFTRTCSECKGQLQDRRQLQPPAAKV